MIAPLWSRWNESPSDARIRKSKRLGDPDADDTLFVVLSIGLGITIVGFGAVLFQTWNSAWIGLLWALSLYALGVFVGFLFSVSRVVENTAAAGNVTSPLRYLPNTGLEQIADWLTKIIVGLSLVELKKIPSVILSFSAVISASLGNGDGTKGLAYAMVVFFPIVGFLGMYLSTRLYLNQGMRKADDREQQIGNAAGAAVNNSNTSLMNPNLGVTEAVSDTASDIVRIPLEKLNTAGDIAAWSRAQSVLRDWPLAVQGFKKAVALNPLDPKLRLDYAVALFNNEGRSERVSQQIVDELEVGLKLVDASKEPELASRLQENLVLASLYMPPPESFRKAIVVVDQLVHSPLPKRATTYFYAACAYGQKFAYLGKESSSTDPHDLATARQKVLDYTRKALDLDPSLLRAFQRVSDPNYPNKVKRDNDLEAFDDDMEFRSIVPKYGPPV